MSSIKQFSKCVLKHFCNKEKNDSFDRYSFDGVLRKRQITKILSEKLNKSAFIYDVIDLNDLSLQLIFPIQSKIKCAT